MKELMNHYRKTYETLLPEINANIEKYRKGNFKIKVIAKDGTSVPAAINIEQKQHAFDFGTNVLMLGSMGEKEQAYRDAVSNLFHLVTTTFCWNIMETTPGSYRFEEGSEEIYRRPPSDRVLAFAKEKNLKLKGQPLFCGCWCPDWIPHDFDQFKKYWITYVTEVAKRYDGVYNIFDVVNESYQVHGSWKNMSWLPISAAELMKWMLQTAGEIFSDRCILERNETTRVNYGAYADLYYRDNKQLLTEGVRLDSIGFQFHFTDTRSCLKDHISSTGAIGLETIYNTYKRMSTLGVPLYITEITIPSIHEGLSAKEGELLQAEILEKLYRLWFSIPGMQGIIYWNLKDGDTWIGENDCRGCLIDEYMRKKKSYYALEHLIKREWNTCTKGTTDNNGILTFSGFYGDYDITVQTKESCFQKHRLSFTKETDIQTITV